MKKITLPFILFVVLASCGGGAEKSIEKLISEGNLEAIKSKKQEISERQKSLNNDIKLLDSVINSLDENKKLPLVTTLKAEQQTFNHFLELQGDVMTKQNVLIYPEMSGTLVKVYVKEGDRVSKGQERLLLSLCSAWCLLQMEYSG